MKTLWFFQIVFDFLVIALVLLLESHCRLGW